MSTLVSVIVPCYNMERYVKQTLHSILASRYDNFEVIVVDDGSTDGSSAIVEDIASTDNRVKLIKQANAGVSAARNNAIRHSNGVYILPVDADDLISDDYISRASYLLDSDPQIKAVGARGEFFGERTGEWHTAPFSLERLAMRNMIPVSAMYRRSDYDTTTGYNEQFPFREDWDFWLSMFANGGKYVKLDIVGLKYRVTSGSKRVADRQRKRELIDTLNKRHSDFFAKYLGGPLHYHRSWSRLLNLFRKETIVGSFNNWEAGEVIHSGRNIVRVAGNYVIKSFGKPRFLKALMYGFFRKSKARRSYEYALLLGNITPQPIAYREVKIFGLLRESYYVSRKSECSHIIKQLINDTQFPNRENILRRLGRFTADLHNRGIYHNDYSAGNILFSESGMEIIDLNRLRFFRHISISKGYRQFERLPFEPAALEIIMGAYREARE